MTRLRLFTPAMCRRSGAFAGMTDGQIEPILSRLLRARHDSVRTLRRTLAAVAVLLWLTGVGIGTPWVHRSVALDVARDAEFSALHAAIIASATLVAYGAVRIGAAAWLFAAINSLAAVPRCGRCSCPFEGLRVGADGTVVCPGCGLMGVVCRQNAGGLLARTVLHQPCSHCGRPLGPLRPPGERAACPRCAASTELNALVLPAYC